MSQNDTPERTESDTSMDSSGRPKGASEAGQGAHQEAHQGAQRVASEGMPSLLSDEALEPQDEPSAVIQIGSTTLARLPESKRPDPSTVCEGCPAAMWYARGEKVLCYCRILHHVSWETGEKDPITMCDGPAIASQ